MTDQSPENTQFFLTAAMPCPYLPDQKERKLFTHLSGRRAEALHQILSEHGFRRSQNLIYRPACEACSACKSVRVKVPEFSGSARHRRICSKNRDIISTELPPRATLEQYELFKTYVQTRHEGGGMTQMSYVDYEFMVEDTPVGSTVVEYRLTNDNGEDGPLVAVALSDLMHEGLSMIYSFFDPELSSRSLGNFMILDHIRRVKDAGQQFVYLGYWVKDSAKMAYKVDFQPLEIQAGELGWQSFTDFMQSET